MSYDDDLDHGDRQLIATFGRPVRLPSHAPDEFILAIFDEPYGRTDIPGGGFIQGKVITLTAISSEIDGIVKRDTIEIPMKKPGSQNAAWDCWKPFTVREIQPDGSGLSVVYLDPKTTSSNSADEVY